MNALDFSRVDFLSPDQSYDEQLYNAVLRPYFSRLSAQGLTCCQAYDDFMEEVLSDENLTSYLGAYSPDAKSFLDLDLANRQTAVRLVNARIFEFLLNDAACSSLLSRCKVPDLLKLAADTVAGCHITIDNENVFFQKHSLKVILSYRLYHAAANSQQQPATASNSQQQPATASNSQQQILTKKGTLLCLTPQGDLCASNASLMQCAKLMVLAQSDRQVQSLLQDNALKSTGIPTQVIKRVLGTQSNIKLYETGNGFSVQPQTPNQPCTISATLADLIVETRVDALSFDASFNFALHESGVKKIQEDALKLLITSAKPRLNLPYFEMMFTDLKKLAAAHARFSTRKFALHIKNNGAACLIGE